jgi:Beta/Gamma crystallin
MKRFVGILLAAGSAAALAGMAQAQPGGGGPRAILFEQPNFQGRSITIVEGSPNLGDGSFAARAMSARFDGDWTVCDAPDLDGRCVTARGYVANLAQLGLGRIASMGGNAPDDAQSDSYRQPAATMANADTPSERAVSEAADDEQVPGARVGGRYGSYDAPPPAPPTTAAQPVGPAPVAVVQAAEGPPPAALAAAAAQAAPTGAGTMQQVAFTNPPAGPAASGVAQAVQSDAGPAAVFFAKPMHGAAEVPIDAQGPANQFCRDQGLGPAVYFDTDGHVLHDIVCRRP